MTAAAAANEITSFDVTFFSHGDSVQGTLHLPPGASAPLPGVVLGHGFGVVADGDLQDYARTIASRGIVCLTFDYRRLGRSGGLPRQEINPFDQIEDFQQAISYLASRSEVDPSRIGIWGSSYGGGHVLKVAAVDSRVQCVVSQVPTISGFLVSQRRPASRRAELDALFAADRLVRAEGGEPGMITLSGPVGTEGLAYPGVESYEYMQSQQTSAWRNEATIHSIELARGYEPGIWIPRIAPKPLLLIVADRDTQTPTDLQLEAFAQAREPKELLLVPGGHYSVYQEHFDRTSAAAAGWFERHL